ncbi:hypothetical protein CBR_g17162 [Chara braunii]|uniref:GmrSD restriction endonucleases N-terminal domain-containing protein n=1 Tax=Chara braunii TaxID=69332 RepID=A0A388KUT2_CHABU|nr:hypothetical protein CBR_g17162 [Chara braunii]|eukprot:GBG73824.1 hypothetical protein CBR_g17162 [Chara braunii]
MAIATARVENALYQRCGCCGGDTKTVDLKGGGDSMQWPARRRSWAVENLQQLSDNSRFGNHLANLKIWKGRRNSRLPTHRANFALRKETATSNPPRGKRRTSAAAEGASLAAGIASRTRISRTMAPPPPTMSRPTSFDRLAILCRPYSLPSDQGSKAHPRLCCGGWSSVMWTNCRIDLSLGHSSCRYSLRASSSPWASGTYAAVCPGMKPTGSWASLRPSPSYGGHDDFNVVSVRVESTRGADSSGSDGHTRHIRRRRRESGKLTWRRVDALQVAPNEPLLEDLMMDDQNEESRNWVGNSDQQRTENRLVLGEKTLQINKADFTVSSVLDKIRRGKLDLRPSYQRDFVWDKKTASKLIESLLLNIPVPTLFFHERQKGVMEVVDGKQRLTSIWSFIEQGTFPDGTEFSLTGLEVLSRLNNMKYGDLDDSYKEAIQDFALNVHTISRHSDDDVVFEVFERLNMGSTQLNEQELRNCIYQGSYNDLLEELARFKDMLKVMKSDVPHKRMRDRELILRFFALQRGGINGFIMPVKKWLNEEMRINQALDPFEKQEMKMDFQRAISLANGVFGDQAFRILRLRPHGAEAKWEADVNVALWDTIMFGFSQLSSIDEDVILKRAPSLRTALEHLMTKDARFRASLISNPKALEIRWRLWDDVLNKEFGTE